MTVKIYYSNDIHLLSEAFTNVVFNQSKDLFNLPEIIIPNPYLMKWLKLQFIESNHLFINKSYNVIESGLFTICQKLTSINKPIEQLDEMTLTVSIIEFLQNNKPILPKEYKNYLYDSENNIQDRKLYNLSLLLANLFLEYENSRNELISKWENNEQLFTQNKIELFQKKLYTYLFLKNNNEKQNLETFSLYRFWKYCQNQNLFKKKNINLILFGANQLSELHATILYNIAKHIDITLFQLNPCSEFWEDIETPGEEKWSKIQRIKLLHNDEGEYLEDNEQENLLLKFWGKAGRETIKKLTLIDEEGSKELFSESIWLESNILKRNSVLSIVKNQILHLQNTSVQKINQDKSIQIIGCNDIYSEVESIFASISANIRSDPSLKLTDCAILIPDMDTYAPVVHAVSSKYKDTLPCSIIDASSTRQSFSFIALKTFFNFAEHGFDKNELYQLFKNPCFLSAINSTIEETNIWVNWIEELHIYKNKTDDIISDNHNLNYGKMKLMLGRIISNSNILFEPDEIQDYYNNIIPFSTISSQNDSALNNFIYIIELIFTYSALLQKTPKSGKTWHTTISKILDMFIKAPLHIEEEQFVINTIRKKMKNIQHLQEVSYDLLHSILFSKDISLPLRTGSYLISGINISAMIPKRQIPFKIIYIPGMQEGTFPGSETASSLDLKNIKRKIGDISIPDANRYVFLETVLLTEQKLYISYVNKDLQKDKEFMPNSIVLQLVSYLEENILTDSFNIQQYPFNEINNTKLNINDKQFVYSDFFHTIDGTNVLLNIISPIDQMIVKKPLERNTGLKTSFSSQNKNSNINNIIQVSKLSLFLSNPAESVLRKNYELYDSFDFMNDIETDEPLFSKHSSYIKLIKEIIEQIILKNKNFTNAFTIAFNKIELFGELPGGTYNTLTKEQLFIKCQDFFHKEHKGVSLQKTLTEFSKHQLYYNIQLGEKSNTKKSDVHYSVVLNKKEQILFSGNIDFLWKSINGCYTLKILATSKILPSHMLDLFLFYCIARSNIHNDLYTLVGESLTVSVFAQNEYKTIIFDFDASTAMDYLHFITDDFLATQELEMIPINVLITTKSKQFLAELAKDFSDETNKKFLQSLKKQIETNLESSYNTIYFSKTLELTEPIIPNNSYEIIKTRLGLFFDQVDIFNLKI